MNGPVAFILSAAAVVFVALHFRYMRICERYGYAKAPHYAITGIGLTGLALIGWAAVVFGSAP